MTFNVEQDTLGWLRNKLSSSENAWSSTTIASQLNETMLKYIYDSFLQLEAKEKIQLLLSFLEIPLRNMESYKENLNRITYLAQTDTNEWVKVAATIVSDYPNTQTICSSLEEVTTCFSETLEDVKTEVERLKLPISSSTLPLECPYLNPTILNYMCGTQPAPVKHFTLRRKPKSAALRAKIAQKASDTSIQKRVPATLSSSKANKKVVSQANKITAVSSHCKAFLKSSSVPKKTKLLDIADQPVGVREQKKRKKVLEMEAQEKKKILKQQKHEDEKQDEAESSSDEENEESGEEASCIDSATSLDDSNQDDTVTKLSLETPAYALLPDASAIGPGPQLNKNIGLPPQLNKNIGPPSQIHKDPVLFTSQNFPYSHNMLQSDLRHPFDYNPSSSAQSLHLQRELQMRVQEEQEMRLHEHQQRYSQQLQQQQQQPMFSMYGTPSCLPGLNTTPTNINMPLESPAISLSHQIPQPTQSHHVAQPTQPQPPKKNYILSREQMLAAHEMFNSSNRITRAEKALILGFMAGNRENPFPQQGPIITIKLSENIEKDDNQVEGPQKLVEMLFEMNYDSGNWRRLKRTRLVNQQAI
uniref:Negative elongation factor A n=1 Tax=Hydra vulgaris TaxID=6087 RepID=T2M5I2_HYDVU